MTPPDPFHREDFGQFCRDHPVAELTGEDIGREIEWHDDVIPGNADERRIGPLDRALAGVGGATTSGAFFVPPPAHVGIPTLSVELMRRDAAGRRQRPVRGAAAGCQKRRTEPKRGNGKG